MNITNFQTIIVTVLFYVTAQAAHASDSWRTHSFTNETIIANSHVVISTLISGDAESKARVEALIGSEIAFNGEAKYAGGGTNLILESNVVLNVEMQPAANVRTSGAFSTVEILGTLKKVDFEKKIIYIIAKPKDYKTMLTL